MRHKATCDTMCVMKSLIFPSKTGVFTYALGVSAIVCFHIFLGSVCWGLVGSVKSRRVL